ncbi:ATP-binding protein [Sinosporangium siamense]|uniref:Histidine kinase/HSP90-like ATPase domain-containing protein n=1 Tax=Sinosporangium siamense TaxID=1367973 RepID=A0A919RC49_9ACTN|nr:ATP-binding protein [Sinosporangium siamense]GII91210.1 hypothetical protein Ssi02_14410 [Sinosporangium siamense]
MTANLARRQAATGTAPDWLLKAIGDTDPAVASAELDTGHTSAKDARDFTSEVLHDWGLLDMCFEVRLVVSELVTNALRHAGGAHRLYVLRRTTDVLCAVLDAAAAPPAAKETTDEFTESGRGLHLVTALSSQWNWALTPFGGKLVWAVFPVESPPFPETPTSTLIHLGAETAGEEDIEMGAEPSAVRETTQT